MRVGVGFAIECALDDEIVSPSRLVGGRGRMMQLAAPGYAGERDFGQRVLPETVRQRPPVRVRRRDVLGGRIENAGTVWCRRGEYVQSGRAWGRGDGCGRRRARWWGGREGEPAACARALCGGDVSAWGRRTSTGWQTAPRILLMERGRTQDESDELVINALGVGRAVRRKEGGWEVEEI
jgi:hypothetical protein